VLEVCVYFYDLPPPRAWHASAAYRTRRTLPKDRASHAARRRGGVAARGAGAAVERIQRISALMSNRESDPREPLGDGIKVLGSWAQLGMWLTVWISAELGG